MLVVDMELWSAVTGEQMSLGLIIIDNISTYNNGRTADYRVRAWAKGTTIKHIKNGKKPMRESKVLSHPRQSKPVWNLLMKALDQMGYA